jgi:hypothetical protein
VDETKLIWKSRGFWGGVVAVLAGMAGMIGYEISPDTQDGLLNYGEGIVACVGGLIAIWGRIKASKRIK